MVDKLSRKYCQGFNLGIEEWLCRT